MSNFLDNYEASRARLERWLITYPQGRIETRIVEFSAERGYVLVEAKAFRNQEELLPAGIDYAYGYQGAYTQNMKRWFVEDTTTSAIMRVQQLVMGGAERSTRETMEQVENVTAKNANVDTNDYWTSHAAEVPSYKTAEEAELAGVASFGSSVQEIAQQMGGTLIKEAPMCKHGHMIWKTGNSKKTGKDWANYSCVERGGSQCAAHWYEFTSDGTWKPQL